MKKMFLAFVLALFAVTAVKLSIADPTDNINAPFVSKYGSAMLNDSMVSYGRVPGDQAGDAIPCTAHVAISKGDIVVLIAGTAPLASYLLCVSKTTTTYDYATFGIALNTVTAGGQTVYVRRNGLCLVNSAISVTLGDKYVTSATAGKVTITAVDAAADSSCSMSGAVMVTAAETETFAAGAGGGKFLAIIGR